MSIITNCPSCGKHYEVADAFAGKKARCHDCAAVFRLPGKAVQSSTPATSKIPVRAAPAKTRSRAERERHAPGAAG